jgi:hypothetical protein
MGAFSRLRSYRLSPWGQTWLGRGIAVIGFLVLARVLLVQGIVGDGGGGGIDAIAYWTAAKAAASGISLYQSAEGVFGAYAYPPPLAHLLAPFSGLPVAVFVWGWRFVEIACLRIAVGSWTRAGWALFFPPVLAELDAGNVHLIMAAVCSLAMRGAAAPIGPSALFKFASLPLVPIGWVRDRRGLIGGVAVAAVVCVVSILLDRQGWSDWLAFLSRSTIPSGLHNVMEAVPLPLRLVAAAALGLAAIRWVRLAPIAVVLAYPVVWIDALSTLVAVFAPVPARQPAPAVDERSPGQAAAASVTVST